jgi:hypothetical protein
VKTPKRPNFEAGEEVVDRLCGIYDSDYCAITSLEGWVRLFSLSQQKFVTEFFTRTNPCGVNVALSSGDRYCFVSPGYSWGIGCFDSKLGTLLWKRAGPGYGISFCPASQSLYAFCKGTKALRLNPDTGSVIESYRGIHEVYASPHGNGIVTVEARKLCVRDSAMKEMFSAPRESWAVLDVAWAEKTVAISEVRTVKPDGTRAGIRCFDLRTGTCLWRYVGRKGHVKPMMYRPARQAYVGIDFKGSPDDAFLLQWDERTGEIVHEESIPCNLHGEFCSRGELMIVADRKVHALSVLKIE